MIPKTYTKYVIKRPDADVFIKLVVAPPRLCDWTKNKDEAQLFDNSSEAIAAAEYIKDNAFNVVADSVRIFETDDRIVTNGLINHSGFGVTKN